MKWSESIKGYEDYLKLEKSLSPNSVIAYINDVNKFVRFLEDNNYKHITPAKVKLSHLKNLLNG